MIRIALIVCVVVLLYACDNNLRVQVVEKYETGEPKVRVTQIANDTNRVVWEELYKSGQVKIVGEMKNNERIGLWKAFFEDGKIWSKGDYVDGKREGYSQVFYPNGVLKMSGYYKSDIIDSIWIVFEPNGDTAQVAEYKNGELIKSFDKTIHAPLKH